MKEIKLPFFFFLLIVSLAGCGKIQLPNVSNNNGSCCNYDFSFFSLKIKKVNNYPAGSHLLVERHGHPKNDSSAIYHFSQLNTDLPINDTTLTGVEFTYYRHYATWKVTAANGDSLSSGSTPMATNTSATAPFQINY